MKNHLEKYHNPLYLEYLRELAKFNKDKASDLREQKSLEEEVESTHTALAEAGGSREATMKRPLTQPITKYFESGKGPSKYPPDSDSQRRADLDLAIYCVTVNEPFRKIESVPFRR